VPQGSRDAVTEQLFVKSKIAKLVVELAKRDWPQRWPSMTTTLLEQAAQRETSCELVLRIVCDLAEAVTEYSFLWPERRRAELQQGLVVTMPQLFALLTHTLSTQLLAVQSQGGPAPHTCVAGTLLQNALQAVHALVDWISLDIIFAGDVLTQVCSLLELPNYFLVYMSIGGECDRIA
jgi:exportin-5